MSNSNIIYVQSDIKDKRYLNLVNANEYDRQSSQSNSNFLYMQSDIRERKDLQNIDIKDEYTERIVRENGYPEKQISQLQLMRSLTYSVEQDQIIQKQEFSSIGEDVGSTVGNKNDTIIHEDDKKIMDKIREINRVKILLQANILKQVSDKKAEILEEKVNDLQNQHDQYVKKVQQETDQKNQEAIKEQEEKYNRIESENKQLLGNLKSQYENVIQDLIKQHNQVTITHQQQLIQQKESNNNELNKLEDKQKEKQKEIQLQVETLDQKLSLMKSNHDQTVSDYQQRIKDEVEQIKSQIVERLNQALSHSETWKQTQGQKNQIDQQLNDIVNFVQNLASQSDRISQLEKVETLYNSLQAEHSNVYNNSKFRIKQLESQVETLQSNLKNAKANSQIQQIKIQKSDDNQEKQSQPSAELLKSSDSSATDGAEFINQDKISGNSLRNCKRVSDPQMNSTENLTNQHDMEIEEYEYYEEYVTETEDIDSYPVEPSLSMDKQMPLQHVSSKDASKSDTRKTNDRMGSDYSQTSVTNIPYPKQT